MTNKIDRSRKITKLETMKPDLFERQTKQNRNKIFKITTLQTETMTNNRIFWFVLFTFCIQLIAARSVHSSALQSDHKQIYISTNGTTKQDCYKTILQNCGRRFINGYKLVSIDTKDTKNDVLTSQCTLRTAFFECLTRNTRNCKELHGLDTSTEDEFVSFKHEGNDKKREMQKRLVERVSKFRARRKRRDNIFRKRLANTIWDSRICIYHGSIEPIEKSTSTNSSIL